MKKNLHKFAAMDVIVNALNDKCASLRNAAQQNAEYYADNDGGMPEWAQAENDKNIAIAEYIENFIDKLC